MPERSRLLLFFRPAKCDADTDNESEAGCEQGYLYAGCCCLDNVTAARLVHFNDIAEGDDHSLNSAEKADHGRHAGNDREHREMPFKCSQYMSAIRLHAFDDFFLQSSWIIVEFA